VAGEYGAQMKLIGAGLPRTATLTQKISLEMLGFGPCYHMVNILGDLSLVPQWIDAFEGTSDWGSIFEGSQATVDWPGAFFYRELMEVYPDAKVLLSVRDGAAWARSMRDTIWGVLYGDTMMRDLSAARCRIDPGWASYIELMTAMWEKSGMLDPVGGDLDENALADGMERYNDEVRSAVPADRLLVWSPADGWGPLCEFLEVPVPSAPLPRVNDSAMFADRLNESAIDALVKWQEQRRAEAAGR
jgi:Sulfotransferase domain